VALGQIDRIGITKRSRFSRPHISCSRHRRLASFRRKFHRTGSMAPNTGKVVFLRVILNVRSINITEIALDFNRLMRA
jgi:hypothetical protein